VPVNTADDPETVVIPVYMREITYVVFAYTRGMNVAYLLL